jgi:Beta-lactamase enzyme family
MSTPPGAPTSSVGPTSRTVTRRTRAEAAAARRIAAVGHDLGAHGVSAAALDLSTGTTFATGSPAGMTEGSIAKLDILETLLLHRQRSGAALSGAQQDLATAMIEQSDNEAANDLWVDEGGRTAVAAANRQLGLHSTVLGSGIYWGLSTTGARDQLTLLDNLVKRGGPLSRASQRFILDLMRHVEPSQRWGVGVVADPGTPFENKNGWLANDSDGDRWLVNSLGVVTVDGHQVLLAVLTQHEPDFDTGVDRTQLIARALVQAVG